jgi:hypothetical protein
MFGMMSVIKFLPLLKVEVLKLGLAEGPALVLSVSSEQGREPGLVWARF